jgi:cytochrome P450
VSLSSDGVQVKNLDIAVVRNECPLLVSTFEETLRYVSASTSTMIIHEDVWLDDRYLLTKSALVQIPATAVHSDATIWRPNAISYNPERFCESIIGRIHVHSSADRTFGGGNTLCPGRHLASDEVLGITVLFLSTLRVELEAKSGQPRRDEINMLSVMKPKGELLLSLTRFTPVEKVKRAVA